MSLRTLVNDNYSWGGQRPFKQAIQAFAGKVEVEDTLVQLVQARIGAPNRREAQSYQQDIIDRLEYLKTAEAFLDIEAHWSIFVRLWTDHFQDRGDHLFAPPDVSGRMYQLEAYGYNLQQSERIQFMMFAALENDLANWQTRKRVMTVFRLYSRLTSAEARESVGAVNRDQFITLVERDLEGSNQLQDLQSNLEAVVPEEITERDLFVVRCSDLGISKDEARILYNNDYDQRAVADIKLDIFLILRDVMGGGFSDYQDIMSYDYGKRSDWSALQKAVKAIDRYHVSGMDRDLIITKLSPIVRSNRNWERAGRFKANLKAYRWFMEKGDQELARLLYDRLDKGLGFRGRRAMSFIWKPEYGNFIRAYAQFLSNRSREIFKDGIFRNFHGDLEKLLKDGVELGPREIEIVHNHAESNLCYNGIRRLVGS